MKHALLLAAAAAMTLGATVASAQPYGGYRDDGYHSRGGYTEGRRYDRNDRDARNYGAYRGQWSRGSRLPPQYRSHTYIVNDYGRYGYRAPPRGYAYYRTDTGDVVLAAIATGIIASVIAGALNNQPGYYDPGYGYGGIDRYGRPY